MPSISNQIKPPKTEEQVVEEVLHGITVLDPFRYLEDANDPRTQRFVCEQNAWTRSLLDPLAGRDQIRGRLAQLLSIGAIGAPPL